MATGLAKLTSDRDNLDSRCLDWSSASTSHERESGKREGKRWMAEFEALMPKIMKSGGSPCEDRHHAVGFTFQFANLPFPLSFCVSAGEHVKLWQQPLSSVIRDLHRDISVMLASTGNPYSGNQ